MFLIVMNLEDYADGLYDIMRPQFGTLVGFSQAIGGAGALFYVFSKIWASLARAEPIDVMPLLRPLAVALCLAFYVPIVDTLMWFGNALDDGTASMVSVKDDLIAAKVKERDDLWIKKREELNTTPSQDPAPSWGAQMWDSVTGLFAVDWDAFQYKIGSVVETIVLWLLKTLLRILTLVLRILNRFFICVLAICGPITFGLACYEWFYPGLAAWFKRFIHLLLWMPIANVFGAMMNQVYLQALQLDIDQFNTSAGAAEFTNSDMMLILFYACCCTGYYLVPTVASWVIESTGVDNALRPAMRPFAAGASAAGATAGGVAGYGAAAGGIRGSRGGGGLAGAGRGTINSMRNRASRS